MNKLNLRKELKKYYTATPRPGIINLLPGKFLTITGKGDPKGHEYQEALQSIYGMSYAIKFEQKSLGIDYTVMYLEGLWWIEHGIFDINSPTPREQWYWKSMIRQPDFITVEMIENIRPDVREKRGKKVDKVKLETFNEGLCAQVLHIGP